MNRILASVLALFLYLPSFGGVVVKSACPNDFKATDFPFVGGIHNKLNGSSGSAVVLHGGEYIITVKHCVTLSGDLTEDVVPADQILFITENKNYKISEIYASTETDLAICKLVDKMENGIQIIPYVLDEEIYGVGVGRGASVINHDKLIFDLPYGTKRVFKNELQGLFIKNHVDKDKKEHKVMMYYYLLRQEFSAEETKCSTTSILQDVESPIMGEGMQGPGDSGGGIFTRFDDKFYLIGTIAAIYSEKPITGFAVELTSHKNWIETIVPNAFYDPFAESKCSAK